MIEAFADLDRVAHPIVAENDVVAVHLTVSGRRADALLRRARPGVATTSPSSTRGTIKTMDLPEHWQPSRDGRILSWVGTLAALTAAAIWVRRARTGAQRSRESQ
jgi:hypothetical protein